MDQQPPNNNLPPLDLTALDAELRNEQAYGDSPIEAYAGQALSDATFGLSDAALRAAGVPAERLREVRERSPVATGLGAATGIIGPAVATMGGSAAAQVASLPARGVMAVGGAAEKLAAKASAKGLAAEALGMGARGAAEGAAIGAGQYVSDVALENQDLSAEAALATMGHGALLGGGFGAVLGTAQATLPKVGAKASKLKENTRAWARQALGPLADDAESGLYTVAGTAAERQKLRGALGERIESLPSYLKQDLELGAGTTTSQLQARNNAAVRRLGDEIGSTVQTLDKQVAQLGTSIERRTAWQPLVDKLENIAEDIGPASGIARNQLRMVERYKKDLLNMQSAQRPFSFGELNDLRMQLNQVKFKGGGALESFEAKMAAQLAHEARAVLDQVATQASPELGAKLQNLNLRYGIGNAIKKPLAKLVERAPNLSSPIAFGLTAAGQVARNAAVLTDMAARTKAVGETINSGIDKIIARAPTKGKFHFPSTRVMVESGFAMRNNERPKTKQQAFANIQANLLDMSDQEKLIDTLAKKTSRIANANPAIGASMQQKLVLGLQFLQSKMPKPGVQQGAFARAWAPSTMELAKFERYLQMIEHPLSAINELEQGTLTREHVEALKTVYPEIYSQMQQKLMEAVSAGAQLPYAKKLQLGILLDVPADSSLQPENLLQLQQTIAIPPAASAPAQATPARADSLKMSNREATEVQKLQEKQ